MLKKIIALFSLLFLFFVERKKKQRKNMGNI